MEDFCDRRCLDLCILWLQASGSTNATHQPPLSLVYIMLPYFFSYFFVLLSFPVCSVCVCVLEGLNSWPLRFFFPFQAIRVTG